MSAYTTKAGERWRIRFWEVDDDGNPTTRRTKGGFLTEAAARTELRRVLVDLDAGTYAKPSALTVKAYAEEWLAGRRLAATTIAGYRKNLRNHVLPYIGHYAITKVRATTLAKLYRDLETHGRRDKGHEGEPLGPGTVRKVHDLLVSIFKAAVDEGLLRTNPAQSSVANPPTAKEVDEARPEVNPWTVDELRTFTRWATSRPDDLTALWIVAANTGLRRGELAGLRWGDLDVKARRLSVRRAVILDKQTKPQQIAVKRPKGGKTRVVDLDESTVTTLTRWRAQLAGVNLGYTARDSWMFPNVQNGQVRSPENLTRRWSSVMKACATALGEDAPHPIKLHDLRHTHATLLLQASVHPKVVQERLGHSTIAITLNLYSHVIPTVQREAVEAFAQLVEGA